MLAYRTEALVALASYHRNNFDNVPIGVVSGTTLVPLFFGERFTSFMAAAKYTFPGVGTSVAVAGHNAQFSLRGNTDPEVRTWTASIKHPVGAFDLTAAFLHTYFTNYTKGKDRGLMLGVDYNFSKRTALYSRFGGIKDKRGNVVVSSATPLPMVVMIGTCNCAISKMLRPMASDWLRSSASIPGYAPGVSTNVNTGSLNFSAVFMRRKALR